MHLLDTPVVLALRDAKAAGGDAGLSLWASGVARQSLFVSALTLHELERHAAHALHRDRNVGALWRDWIDGSVMRAFDGRILPVDAATVRRAATLDYGDARDALLAAAALEHGMTLVTFRTRAFRAGRVKTFDPTGYAPEPSVDDWRQAARATPAWIRGLFVRS